MKNTYRTNMSYVIYYKADGKSYPWVGAFGNAKVYNTIKDTEYDIYNLTNLVKERRIESFELIEKN